MSAAGLMTNGCAIVPWIRSIVAKRAASVRAAAVMRGAWF